MNQECFPTHPSTNSSLRKLRLKILTSDGKRFICPVSYQCTIQQLADRILKVYTQFQRDPTHKYHTSEQRLAKRVYNIRSHSYYLGRTDYVGDLLNDLDEIQCDVEQNRKKNDKRKEEEQKSKSKKKNKEKRKQKILEKIEQKERQKIVNQNQHDKNTNKNSAEKHKKEIKNSQPFGLPPKSPLLSSRSPQLNALESIKKQSIDILQLQKKSQQGKHFQQLSLQPKRSEDKPSSFSQNMRKSMSPKITPIQNDKLQKLNLNKDISSSQKKKNKESKSLVVKTKQDSISRDSASKPSKPLQRTDSIQKQDNKQNKNSFQLQNEPQNKRKKSLMVIESEQEKQDHSNFANLYNHNNIEENARKIFNRFDDESD